MSKQFDTAESDFSTEAGGGLQADQTREARKRIFKAGIASYQNDSLTANCVVRDINEHGAKLRFEEGAFVPEKFALCIPVDGTKRDCEVKWRRNLDMGVVFVSEVEEQTRTRRRQGEGDKPTASASSILLMRALFWIWWRMR